MLDITNLNIFCSGYPESEGSNSRSRPYFGDLRHFAKCLIRHKPLMQRVERGSISYTMLRYVPSEWVAFLSKVILSMGLVFKRGSH